MFKRLVAIEPIRLSPRHLEELSAMAEQVEFHRDIPRDNGEIIRRIGGADAVLLSYTSAIDREVLDACPGLRYIGMCCSLYAPESANVDILRARELGIAVTGVKDYGDEGVPEYVISELVRLLHGFGGSMFRQQPLELTGLPVGVLGLGTTGKLVARALGFFGAEVYYYSRTRKPELEESEGYRYLPLEELLPKVDILCTCLTKNIVLLGDGEFGLLGNNKILINTSIGPAHDTAAAARWLARRDNYLLCDIPGGIDPTGRLLELPNVICAGKSAGMTSLAVERLGKKAVDNMRAFLNG